VHILLGTVLIDAFSHSSDFTMSLISRFALRNSASIKSAVRNFASENVKLKTQEATAKAQTILTSGAKVGGKTLGIIIFSTLAVPFE
jgi:hypothetical protein